jgi:hypothetical protein
MKSHNVALALLAFLIVADGKSVEATSFFVGGGVGGAGCARFIGVMTDIREHGGFHQLPGANIADP